MIFFANMQNKLYYSQNKILFYLEYPPQYLDLFDTACESLPAVLRNAPFFDAANELCVGSTFADSNNR